MYTLPSEGESGRGTGSATRCSVSLEGGKGYRHTLERLTSLVQQKLAHHKAVPSDERKEVVTDSLTVATGLLRLGNKDCA